HDHGLHPSATRRSSDLGNGSSLKCCLGWVMDRLYADFSRQVSTSVGIVSQPKFSTSSHQLEAFRKAAADAREGSLAFRHLGKNPDRKSTRLNSSHVQIS